jgi:phospholipid transport system transporter-binding protein
MAVKRKTARPRRARAPSAPAVPIAAPMEACLPAALTMRELGPVAARLRAAIDSGVAEIDASAVATVDTAGVQLLVAAVLSAARLGKPLRWRAASPALTEAAAQLGLAASLGLGAGAAGA